jgi:hypothetical protein
MRLNTNQRMTHLGTSREFDILQPENFPKGPKGLVFISEVQGDWHNYIVAVRTDAPSGQWRIDRHVLGHLWDAIPGLDELFDTPELAAQKLVARFGPGKLGFPRSK